MNDAWFHPYVSTLWPFGSLVRASVVAKNQDGTVNLVAHDGNDTPQENVPVFAQGADAPEAGFFAVLDPKADSDSEPVAAEQETADESQPQDEATGA